MEGEYNIAGLEEKYQLDRWRAAGKHAVLRFVCDRPGDETHMDIPQWLYERTGDGVFMIPAMERGTALTTPTKSSSQPIRTLSGRSVNISAGTPSSPMWSSEVWGTGVNGTHCMRRDFRPCRILKPAGNTPTTILIPSSTCVTMRRNYVIATDGNMGLYNDMVGHAADTQEWLDWQADGGYYELPDGQLPYEPVEEIWNTAPVGGEFTGSIPMEQILTEDWSRRSLY